MNKSEPTGICFFCEDENVKYSDLYFEYGYHGYEVWKCIECIKHDNQEIKKYGQKVGRKEKILSQYINKYGKFIDMNQF